MYHFQEAITNIKGDALIGYFVKATDPSDGSVVDIYADESLTAIETVSDVANAAEVDDDGMVSFWIAPGTYDLAIYGSDATTLIRTITDVQMGIADADYGDVVVSDNGTVWTVPSIDGTTVSTFAKTILDDADASAVRTTIGAAIGTDVEAHDALLTSIAGLTFGAGSFIYGTGSDTAAAGTITTFGRSLIDDADAGTALTTLGVSTFVQTILDDADAAAVRATIGAGSGTGDLLSTNNLSDLTNAGTARTNLGAAASGAATSSGLTMATSRLLGRTTASTGAVEEISVGGSLTLSGGVLNVNGAGGFRGALVTKSADQTTANYSTAAAVAFDAEDYDTDTIHDNVTNNTRLTVPSGVTKVRVAANIDASAIGAGSWFRGFIYKNGSSDYVGRASFLSYSDIGNNATVAITTPVLTVVAGDYFEFFFQCEDSSVTVVKNSTWFSLEVIG